MQPQFFILLAVFAMLAGKVFALGNLGGGVAQSVPVAVYGNGVNGSANYGDGVNQMLVGYLGGDGNWTAQGANPQDFLAGAFLTNGQSGLTVSGDVVSQDQSVVFVDNYGDSYNENPFFGAKNGFPIAPNGYQPGTPWSFFFAYDWHTWPDFGLCFYDAQTNAIIRIGTPTSYQIPKFYGIFYGNGGNLTNLPASQITGQLPANTVTSNSMDAATWKLCTNAAAIPAGSLTSNLFDSATWQLCTNIPAAVFTTNLFFTTTMNGAANIGTNVYSSGTNFFRLLLPAGSYKVKLQTVVKNAATSGAGGGFVAKVNFTNASFCYFVSCQALHSGGVTFQDFSQYSWLTWTVSSATTTAFPDSQMASMDGYLVLTNSSSMNVVFGQYSASTNALLIKMAQLSIN